MLKKVLIFSVLLSLVACDTKLSSEEKQEYTKKGKEIAQASFKELSSNLMQQMKLGGPEQAVPFCNLQAMPITIKMSKKFNVNIKRTSDKVRNSLNKPTKRELQIIEEYKTLLQSNTKLTAIVELNKNDTNKQFYAPIIVNEKCLACHGKLEEQLSIKTDSLVKSLYPNDKAIGYNNVDLRGIWSIEFKN